jgi:hypothetical protein
MRNVPRSDTGGYANARAARCWTHCTAVAVGVPLAPDIPEHAELLAYGPDLRLTLAPGNMVDEDTAARRAAVLAVVRERMATLASLSLPPSSRPE